MQGSNPQQSDAGSLHLHATFKSRRALPWSEAFDLTLNQHRIMSWLTCLALHNSARHELASSVIVAIITITFIVVIISTYILHVITVHILPITFSSSSLVCVMLCVFVDLEALLCYEGLASVEAFWGNEAKARQIFQEGSSRPGGTSRFYRGWALFEKKHSELEVGLSVCLSGYAEC